MGRVSKKMKHLTGATAVMATVLAGLWFYSQSYHAPTTQVIGHSALNWALAHLSATVVSLSVRAEPVVAIALAAPVLGETPSWTVIPGGLLILAGAFLAVRSGGPSGIRSAGV